MGGAAMQDITAQNKALKISWLKRLTENNNSKWKKMIQEQLPKTNNMNYLHFNLKKEDVQKAFPRLYNTFWKEILEEYYEINYKKPEEIENITNQIIWFNSNIKIDNRTIYYQKWEEKNIIKLQDILDNEGKIMEKGEIQRELNINIDFLTYYSIKAAIPKIWLKQLQNKTHLINEEKNPIKLELINQKNASKKIYSHIIRNKYAEPKQLWEKWEKDTGTNINQEKWETICGSIKNNSTYTKIRTFQIKYLNRALPTNYTLYKMKIQKDDLCNFCKQESGTWSHIYWDCPIVVNFWKKTVNWLASITEEETEFNKYETLLWIEN